MCPLIIPRPVHDMNPDSAVMPHISMKIKWIDDFQGCAARGTQENQAGDRRCEGEQAQGSDHHRTGCNKVVQESRLFWVEWLADHAPNDGQ